MQRYRHILVNASLAILSLSVPVYTAAGDEVGSHCYTFLGKAVDNCVSVTPKTLYKNNVGYGWLRRSREIAPSLGQELHRANGFKLDLRLAPTESHAQVHLRFMAPRSGKISDFEGSIVAVTRRQGKLQSYVAVPTYDAHGELVQQLNLPRTTGTYTLRMLPARSYKRASNLSTKSLILEKISVKPLEVQAPLPPPPMDVTTALPTPFVVTAAAISTPRPPSNSTTDSIPIVGSVFPRNRSENRRRIGLTQSNLVRLQRVYAQRNTATTREAKVLKYLTARKSVFNERLTQPELHDKDFAALIGYHYCIKVVSAMGLLSALGDDEATEIAKRAVLRAADPFIGPPISREQARSVLLDRTLPFATRVRALNVLHESGDTQTAISRGETIYLEVAPLSACVAIGYDWLYEKFTPSERLRMETAMQELLLWANNLDNSFFGANVPKAQKESNWNAVMNSGSGLLGLAALDDDADFNCSPILSAQRTAQTRRSQTITDLAKERVCQAMRALPWYWKAFSESGAYVEGPSYWFFGMEVYSIFTDAVQEMLGRTELWDSFGQLQIRTAELQRNLIHHPDKFWTTTTENIWDVGMYGIGDSPQSTAPSSYPFFSIARRAGDLNARNFAISMLDQQLANDEQSLPVNARKWAIRSYDWSRVFTLFTGIDGTATFPKPEKRLMLYTSEDHRLDIARLNAFSAVGDWVVFQKGGSALDPHSHLDSSSFTLRVGSDEWFSDLGRELLPNTNTYPVGYWSLPTTPSYSLGLSFFRKNDLSHNLVTIANRPINISGRAYITSSEEGLTDVDVAPYSRVNWDTTSLYAPVASQATRSLILTQRGRYTTLDVLDRLWFPTMPALDNEGVLATWRGVSCRPVDRTGNVEVETLNGISSARLSRFGPRATDRQALLVAAHRPLNAVVRVSDANPNVNQRIRSRFATGVENSNEGCTLIEVPATVNHLTRETTGGYLLTFVIRIQKELPD